MDKNQIIGYALLGVGLLLIILPLFQAFGVLAGKNLPPEFFKAPKAGPDQNISQMDFQKQIDNSIAKALPTSLLYQSINILLWGLLLTIFMLGGKHIAGLGIQLVRSNN